HRVGQRRQPRCLLGPRRRFRRRPLDDSSRARRRRFRRGPFHRSLHQVPLAYRAHLRRKGIVGHAQRLRRPRRTASGAKDETRPLICDLCNKQLAPSAVSTSNRCREHRPTRCSRLAVSRRLFFPHGDTPPWLQTLVFCVFPGRAGNAGDSQNPCQHAFRVFFQPGLSNAQNNRLATLRIAKPLQKTPKKRKPPRHPTPRRLLLFPTSYFLTFPSLPYPIPSESKVGSSITA